MSYARMGLFLVCMTLLLCMSLSQVTVTEAPPTPMEERRNEQLISAWNAALIRMISSGKIQELSAKHGVPHQMTTYCNPSADYRFPPRAELRKNDRLWHVLEQSKVVIVGSPRANWGPDGDYTKQVPTGFWPELLNSVLGEIGHFYSKNINIERRHDGIWKGIDSGVADMADVYMINNNIGPNRTTSVHHFNVGCPLATTPIRATCLTKHQVNDFDQMYAKILQIPVAQRKIAVLTQANWSTIRAAFPPSCQMVKVDSDTEMLAKIKNEQVFAGVTTGKLDGTDGDTTIRTINTGINAYHGPLFRREDCPREPKVNGSARMSSSVLSVVFLVCGILLTTG
eukprot:Platyproteum_vivax@DN14992_c0_g1_i1.p1